MKAAQKIKASTQKFTEIKDISEDIVVMENGNACLVIKVEAVNFALLSLQEQNSKVYAYISLLNSLPFSIQILIKNEKIDLTYYLKYLEEEAQKTFQLNSKLFEYFKNYKGFIEKTITVNSVLDKNFYIVIPYSYLEGGVKGAKNKSFKKDEFTNQAKISLHTKANSLHSQLARLSLKAKTLQKEELVKLFYKTYNQEEISQAEDYRAPIVRGETKS